MLKAKTGFTIVEMILAVSITLAVCVGIVSYVVFSIKSTVETRKQGDTSLNVAMVSQFIQKKVESADLLDVKNNKFYVRKRSVSGDIIWNVFEFEPSEDVDFETGYNLPGKLYNVKYEGAVDTQEGTRRLVTEVLVGVDYQLIENNFVRVVFNYVKGSRLITRTLYVRALAVGSTRSGVEEFVYPENSSLTLIERPDRPGVTPRPGPEYEERPGS